MTASPGRILKPDQHATAAAGQRLRLAELTETAHASVGRSCVPLAPVSQFQPLLTAVARANAANGKTIAAPPRSDFETAAAALRNAVTELQSQRDVWLEHFQQEAVRLGIAIAERLLRQSLAAQPDRVATLARTALEATAGAVSIRLRLHPADAELIESQTNALGRECGATLELIRDESLSRGDCVAETQSGSVDARLPAMLDRIAEELLDGAV